METSSVYAEQATLVAGVRGECPCIEWSGCYIIVCSLKHCWLFLICLLILFLKSLSHRCAPGYYGDPLIPRGSCRPCNCAGNGNSCDPRTGGKFVEPNLKKKKSYILIMSGLIFKYVVFNGFIFSQFARMPWSQETQPQMNNAKVN